jgi:hypothetical protein
MGTPRWLIGSVIGVVSLTAAMAITWYVSCTFVIGPQLFNAYVRSGGKLVATEPEVCKDVDARALQVLTSLLATLLGLMSNPPSEKP